MKKHSLEYEYRIIGLTSRLIEFYKKSDLNKLVLAIEECGDDIGDSIMILDHILMNKLNSSNIIPSLEDIICDYKYTLPPNKIKKFEKFLNKQ